VLHAKKFVAEASRGMESGKVIWLEAATFEKRNGQGIAECHSDGSAGSRSEVEGAGFFFDADVENNVAGTGESRFGITGESDDRHFQTLQCFEQIQDFLGFAALGDREQRVATSKHTQVTVERFGGMQEERRRTGAGKGGGNLAANQTGLAHTRDDDTAFAREEKIDGAIEGGVEASEEVVQGLRFDLKDATRGIEAHGNVTRES
jgi:hypothetical protein